MTLTATLTDDLGTPIARGCFKDRFDITGKDLERAGETISFSVSLPIRDIAGYFNPSMTDGPLPRLDWEIGFSGSAGKNAPILCFMSQGGGNRYTLYADELIDDFRCIARMNQSTGAYDVRFLFSNRRPGRPFAVHLDTGGGDWTEALARVRKTLRPQGIPVFPEGAFDPVYCTWYAVHACLTQDYLDRNVRCAAELGFGTFIVDDGWSIDEMKRVSPETLDTWYDKIGDWELSREKLPRFRDNVRYAHGLGLRYLVWVAPFFVFPGSKVYGGLAPEELIEERGAMLLDPACACPVRETLGRMRKVVRELGLDGLKVDFIDSLPSDPRNPRGREIYDFLGELAKAVREEAGAEALIEFRQNYATPQMLDFATQFRAGDVPFDYLRNLCRIATIRILLGDDVPIHADPLFWREDELDLTVARHMIASLAGVPMVSMDLPSLSRSHGAIVRHYLGFYRDHRATFAHGRWRIRFTGTIPAYLSVTRGDERIIVLVDSHGLVDATEGFRGAIHVLNLGVEPIAAREAHGPDGRRIGGTAIPCGGRGVL